MKENTQFINIGCNSIIANGDSIDILKNLPDNSVDLIITDPPYNLGKFMRKRGTNIIGMRENHFAYSGWDDLDFIEWKEGMNRFFAECSRILKIKGSMIVFMSIIKMETIIDIALSHGFYYKTTGIWHKTNPMPRNMNIQFVNSTESWLYVINQANTGIFNNNNQCIHDFIETSTINNKERIYGKHPTQKPLKLFEFFINLLSNENDTILDPFMGSGTAGVACEKLERKFLGIELNKEYFNIASNRIKNKI